MGLLDIFKKKNSSMGQLSHVVHFPRNVNSQAQQADGMLQSIFFESTNIHDIANQGITYVCNLNNLKFQYK